MINDMHDALLKKYIVWTEQIWSECKDLCGDMYSNPCYLGVPDGWENATNRIMIVGEEGYGDWGFGKKSGWNEETVQSWQDEFETNHGKLTADERAKLEKMLWNTAPIAVFGDNAISEDGIEKLMRYNTWATKDYHLGEGRKSAFWIRFESIAKLENCAVVWNNIDKIYSRIYRKDSKYALPGDERARLHGVETKILKEEIEILKPNIVLFCGWNEISLKEELPDIAAEYNRRKDEPLELNILKMCVESKVHIAAKRYLCEIKRDGVTYIMSYHPKWGHFQKGYENSVFEMVKSAMKDAMKCSDVQTLDAQNITEQNA